MRYFLLIILCISACSENSRSAVTLQLNNAEAATITPMPPYDSMKIHISNYRKKLRFSNTRTDYQLLEKQFVSIITDSIFPYWYGTTWDFNGTTQVPGKGSIACGYFVATVLRDAGIQLNRIKTGQSASKQIVQNFAEKNNCRVFSDKPLWASLDFVKEKGPGLYITGLDNHVGFLYNDGTEIWFIHSKGVTEKAVIKEVAAQSGILYYSAYRIIGKISNNKDLLNKWLDAK